MDARAIAERSQQIERGARRDADLVRAEGWTLEALAAELDRATERWREEHRVRWAHGAPDKDDPAPAWERLRAIELALKEILDEDCRIRLSCDPWPHIPGPTLVALANWSRAHPAYTVVRAQDRETLDNQYSILVEPHDGTTRRLPGGWVEGPRPLMAWNEDRQGEARRLCGVIRGIPTRESPGDVIGRLDSAWSDLMATYPRWGVTQRQYHRILRRRERRS